MVGLQKHYRSFFPTFCVSVVLVGDFAPYFIVFDTFLPEFLVGYWAYRRSDSPLLKYL